MEQGREHAVKRIYIAGPYRGANAWDVYQNIARAEALGMRVAEMGGLPVIPHTMYRYWDGTLTDDFWLACGIELLDVCDAVCVVTGYANSHGTLAEIKHARETGKCVFRQDSEMDMAQLRAFIATGQ